MLSSCQQKNAQGSAADLPIDGSSFTIEAMVMPTNDVGRGAVVGWGTTTRNRVNAFIFHGSPSRLQNYWIHNDLNANVGKTLADGSYHHVAVTWGGSNHKIYADFQIVGQRTARGYLGSDKSNFCVGRAPIAGDNFKGRMKQVKIWKRALTVEDMEATTTTTTQVFAMPMYSVFRVS